MRRFLPIAALLPLLASCAGRPDPAPVAYVPPPPVAPAPPAFAGYPGVVVPPRLADGSFATPNRQLSAAGAVWHLRAGLNVAALSCRGAVEAELTAGYNALLQAQAGAFAAAYRTLGAEHGGAAGFDAAMTRLYNYWALPPAQPALCTAALAVLREAALLPPGALPGFAPAALARLDAPYVQVFAAQEAWATTRFAARAPSMAVERVAAAAVAAPMIAVDLSVLQRP